MYLNFLSNNVLYYQSMTQNLKSVNTSCMPLFIIYDDAAPNLATWSLCYPVICILKYLYIKIYTYISSL